MKSPYAKLVATVAFLLVAMSLIAVTSYAWLTVSNNPVAEGIQITVGGGNTILLAPDMTVTGGDGTVYHYPGSFSDKLNLSGLLDLEELSGLIPVSTADGLHWYIPTYYTAEDEAVKNHIAPLGGLKDVTEFYADTALEYANVGKEEQSGQGSYLYVDFWVVSPGNRYDLRVSTADEDGVGSYVIGLQDAAANDGAGYQLADSACPAAESVRVGFLANQNTVEPATLAAYRESKAYSSQYDELRGIYQEKGQALSDFFYTLNSFSIYEPNGDSHSTLPELEGSYVITQPVGDDDGVRAVNIGEILSVQMKNTWKASAAEVFQAAVIQAESRGLAADAETVRDYFYHSYLEGQTSPYVNKGSFIANTASIYTGSSYQSGVGFSLSAAALSQLPQAGACSSNRIAVLEHNIPQRVRMFIWLEGQDIDCVDGVEADDFAMSIELAGSGRG